MAVPKPTTPSEMISTSSELARIALASPARITSTRMISWKRMSARRASRSDGSASPPRTAQVSASNSSQAMTIVST